MKIVLRRRAKRDLVEARQWYDERRVGLGDALLEEVDESLDVVRRHPESHPRVDERVRKATLHRFPYGIFYVIESDTIRVIAILHHARNPDAWRRRR